jgi:hypothetical protein
MRTNRSSDGFQDLSDIVGVLIRERRPQKCRLKIYEGEIRVARSKALGHFCFWIFGFFLLYCLFLLFFIWGFWGELGLGLVVVVDVGVKIGVGVPLTKRYSAGIWPTIGVKSGPIGGHGMLFGHQSGCTGLSGGRCA